MFHYFLSCPYGIEQICAEEVQSLNQAHNLEIQELGITYQGLYFKGNLKAMYAINLHSRFANRLLVKVGGGKYRNEDDIYKIAKKIDWFDYFDVNKSMRLSVNAKNSPLRSVNFAMLKAKDAICDTFVKHCGQRPDVDKTEHAIGVHLFLEQNNAFLYLDTTGEALFKRGWRTQKTAAPIKENLAAALIKFSGWKTNQPFIDPFCGSGTIVLEAVLMACNIAPGLQRKFMFQEFKNFDRPLWLDLQKQAQQSIVKTDTPFIANDIDGNAITIAQNYFNAFAMHAPNIKTSQKDASKLLKEFDTEQMAVMVSNLPFGERIGAKGSNADDFYTSFASHLKEHWHKTRCALLSSQPIMKHMRLRSQATYNLKNGNLDCNLFVFDMQMGDFREQAEQSLKIYKNAPSKHLEQKDHKKPHRGRKNDGDKKSFNRDNSKRRGFEKEGFGKRDDKKPFNKDRFNKHRGSDKKPFKRDRTERRDEKPAAKKPLWIKNI